MTLKAYQGLYIFILFVLTACNDYKKPTNVLKIDMGFEFDEGKFIPARGDKLYLTGNFNNWDLEGLALLDTDKDLIYEIPIQEITSNRSIPLDSLEFQFYYHQIRDSDTVAVREVGGERVFGLSALYKIKNPLVFNKTETGFEMVEVNFSVGMSNQKVLGFFKPEKGDKVVVTGNFCNWSEEGFELKLTREDDYKATIPIKINLNEPLEYKYKILTTRDVFMPNNGLESLENRTFLLKERNELKHVYFNDLSRVARFIINTEKWERTGKFKPNLGDYLQIKLIFDDDEQLTDPLQMIKKNNYEIAIAFPQDVDNIEYAVTDGTKEQLNDYKEIKIKLNGTIISIN